MVIKNRFSGIPDHHLLTTSDRGDENWVLKTLKNKDYEDIFVWLNDMNITDVIHSIMQIFYMFKSS